MKQLITTPTPSRRFNSGPRLHSAKAECDQVETKVWGRSAFICGLKRLARWLAVFAGWQRPEMKVVCAWCQPMRQIGSKACRWSEAGTVTHSICPECLALHFPRIVVDLNSNVLPPCPMPELPSVSKTLFRTISGADWATALARRESNPVKDQIHRQLGGASS